MESIRQQFFEHVALTAPTPIGIEVERAKGIYLYGPDGQRWIDFVSGICVMNAGHGQAQVIQAIRQQSQRYLHTMVYGESIMQPQVAYARKLAQALGTGLEKVYFLNGGTEANEAALKMAKKATGRPKIVACHHGYHGSTHGSLSVSGNPTMKQGYGPLLPQVVHIPYNDIPALAAIDGDTACIILEAIQGAGGCIVPDLGYLEAVRAACDQVGALMILDEIQTGFGRTGRLFAFQHTPVKPDIITLAKALGGGLPLGAFATRAELADVIRQDPILGHINTFGGGPVSAAAGLASLTYILDQELIGQVQDKSAIICHELRHPAIKVVRGMGLLLGVIFQEASVAEKVRQELLKRGLLTIGFLNIKNGLRVSPPLTISESELRMSCQIWQEAIEAVVG